MATPGGRTFPNDPDPPVEAPEPRPVPAAPEPEAAGPTSFGVATPGDSLDTSAPVFRVVQREDGTRGVFKLTPDFQEVNLGDAVPDSDDILNAVAVFDPDTKTWDIPEDAAMKLVKGELPFPAYVQAKFDAGKADLTRSLIGLQYVRKEATLDDAKVRGNKALLAAQLTEAPMFAWQGGLGKTVAKLWNDLKDAGPGGVARRVVGDTAQLLPMMADVGIEALKGAGAGAALGAAVSNPAAVVAFAQLGGGLGVFSRSADLETGATAMEFIDKGFDDKTTRTVAPIAGAFKGLLEVVGFKFLTAPLKRAFVSNVLTSAPVRAALANYAKETAGEVGTEVGQTLVDTVATQVAANLEAKPELADNPEAILNDVMNTLLTAGGAMGVIHAPGVALDVGKAKVLSAREAKAIVETKAELAKRDAEVAAEGAQPQTTEITAAQPAIEVEALPPSAPLAEFENAARAALPEAQRQAFDEFMADLDARDRSSDTVVTREQFVARLRKFNESLGAENQAEAAAPTEEQLVQDLNTGTTETFDDAVQGFEEEGTPEAAARLEKVIDAPAPETKTEAKRRSLEREGRVAELNSRLAATREKLKAFRQVWEKTPTPALTEAIDATLVEERGIREDIKALKKSPAARVAPTEAMEVKPPTFEAVMALGFKEGKQESKNRAQQILDVAKANGLTMRDVRRLLKNKRPELLGDKAFKNFMQGYDRTDEETGQVTHVPGFTERVERLLERKRAVKELRGIQHEKKIRGERNVRRLHDLPAVADMTTEQVRQYAEILKAYDVGDVALTPERIRALETAAFGGMGGVRTAQDVVRRAVQNARAPISAFNGIEVDALSLITYDTPLARQHPFLNFMVNYFKATVSRADEVKAGVKTTLDLLGAKAMASRARGIKGLISPAMPEVMAAIEEADATARAAKWEALTPEEREYATFWLTFAQAANDYLVAVDPNFVSRFSGGTYTPHVPKRASEIVASIPDKGLRAAVGELVDQIFPSDAADFFQAPRQQRQALGLRKFLQQTVFRSGQLDPSRNLIRAHREYVDAFYKKVAVDSAVPVIDSIVYGLQSISRDPDAEKLYNGVHAFTKEWLNAKKGNARLLFQKGDFGDRLLRAGMALMSLKYIAVNLALQATAPVGEQAMEIMHLGARGYARAKKRRVSAQGRAILERYKFFTEENPWEQFKQPGRDAVEYLKMASYGMFQFYRTEVMADILLGNMTAEEFAAGEISHERLAEIKTAAGRWLDIHGAKSIVGSTAEGATWTQFKGWAIPPMTSVLSDLKELATPGKTLTWQHFQDLYRASYFVLAYLLMKKGIEDEEDDSFLGQAKKRARRELFSLFQSIDPVMFAGPGVFGDFVVKFAKALKALVTLEEYSPEGARAGELKGPAAVERLVKPAFVRQLESKEDVE